MTKRTHEGEMVQHCTIVQDNVKRNYSQDIKFCTNHCQSSMADAHQHYLVIIGISPIAPIQVCISAVFGACWLC